MDIYIPEGAPRIPLSGHNIEKEGQELGAAFIRTCITYKVDGEVAAVAAATLVGWIVACARANGRDPNAMHEKIGKGSRELAPQMYEHFGMQQRS